MSMLPHEKSMADLPKFPPRIGICFTAEGPGDLSFNSMLYSGSIRVQSQFGIVFSYQTPLSNAEEDLIRALSFLAEEEECELVMTLGFQTKTALDIVAKQYPATQFVLFDVPAAPAENVTSVIFAQHEGAFVAGALAAHVTQTKKIGFIGGVDIDILEAYIRGFQEGIESIDPSVELLVDYCSLLPDFSGFNNPQKGYDIANAMYNQGVDIVFGAAGGSGPGIIQAATEQQKYVIGTDSNQDYMAPGFVLTSVMKRLDTSVIDICQRFIHDELEGNTVYEFGYADGGISLTPMEFTKDVLPKGVLEQIRQIEQSIIQGDITVTNLLDASNE